LVGQFVFATWLKGVISIDKKPDEVIVTKVDIKKGTLA